MKCLCQKTFRLSLLLAIISMIGCANSAKNDPMFNIFEKRDPIEKFWRWFAENKLRFETNPDVEGPSDLDPILRQLHHVSDGLELDVSREINGVRELVISANGDKSIFPIVQKIVDKAPQIEGWVIVPFRQRANKDFVLETPSLRLATGEMYFEPFHHSNEVDLIVYVPDVKGMDQEVLHHFGMIIIDNVLGEYDSVMKVRRVNFRDLTEARDKESLRALSELPRFVDEFYNRTNN